jgi:hypothetical protein
MNTERYLMDFIIMRPQAELAVFHLNTVHNYNLKFGEWRTHHSLHWSAIIGRVDKLLEGSVPFRIVETTRIGRTCIRHGVPKDPEKFFSGDRPSYDEGLCKQQE